ncbi:M20/M25/M40 family metallo-hydrolase [Candidatus Bipolaricaulota bacterium]|nr:M20/M25/M40 family metallo-hydrolase [Candidatus Bipolaricaulota bacterium]
MVDSFCEMVRIDSESGREQEFIQYLQKLMERELGASSVIDAFGNLVCRVPARGSTAAPLLLAAHADTVSPGIGVEPVIQDGVIRSRGETILGADDKAGIAEIIAAVKASTRVPPLEIVVVRCEEIGLKGAKNLDYSLIKATRGVLMDSDVLDKVVIGGPSHYLIDVEVTGRSAHAGMEPEKGVSAIRAAALAFQWFPEGRVDPETTANVGIFRGGAIRNGIPERASLRAECRSLDHQKAERLRERIEKAFREAAANVGARADVSTELACRTYRLSEDAPMVQAAMEAIRACQLEAKTSVITGGTDASVYNENGIETVVLGIGARDEHSVDESVAIEDMEKAAEILVALLERCAYRGRSGGGQSEASGSGRTHGPGEKRTGAPVQGTE